MGINLKSFVFPPSTPDYTASKIMREVDSKLNSQKYQQKQGLVTTGFLSVIQGTGGGTWAVSDLINFPYQYTERPMFSSGMEGTYSGDLTHPAQDRQFHSLELPQPLADYISAEDFTSFSPAIFIPRVIHWYKKTPITWSGCYILVYQLNPNCTELEGKVCRIHYRFEGAGYLS